MAKLDSISIKNIKGISSKIFDLNLFPNKPSILVAPNGFGKSSIACAFKSLNRNRIDLEEKNHYLKDTSNKLELKVVHDGTDYLATDSSNAISALFDISVINSHVKPDAKKRKIAGFTSVSVSLEISSVVLIDRIPDKVKFTYNHSAMKKNFGSSGKILPTAKALFDNPDFIVLIERKIDFTDFNKVRIYKKLISPLIDEINKIGGTAEEVKALVEAEVLDRLKAIVPLRNLASLIFDIEKCSEIESYLLAWQVATESQTVEFKSALEYKLYLRDKFFFDDLLSAADTTRHEIRTKEEKVNKTKKKLVVNFPSADDISNGQRDILSFIAQIQRSLRKLKKQNCILVIDEIFDYLDDANLVAFQYYVTQVIDDFKSQGRNIYPLLLTHLDPAYFMHFCFNKHRLQIRYLNRDSTLIPSVFLKMVKNREDADIEDDVSCYHFHYNPTEKDLEADFQRLSMRKAWGKSHSFYRVVYDEATKYLNGNTFDPIAVLFAVRIKIEEITFNRLTNPEYHKVFIEDCNGTSNKLDYCESIGVQIPEIHYLLGLIYNDNLHWNDKRDYETPLRAKLDNFTIRKMIAEVFL